jgi:hypothetical protein
MLMAGGNVPEIAGQSHISLDFFGSFDPAAYAGFNPQASTEADWQRGFGGLLQSDIINIFARDMPAHFDVHIAVFTNADSEKIEKALQQRRITLEANNVPEPSIARALSEARSSFEKVRIKTEISHQSRVVGDFLYSFKPQTGTAEAIMLDVAPEYQRMAVATRVFNNHLTLLGKLGVSAIYMRFDDIYSAKEGGLTNITRNGMYSALRMGVQPSQWDYLRADIMQDFQKIKPQIKNPQTVQAITAALTSSDPKSAWAIVDNITPVMWEGSETTLGKALLVGLQGEGIMDIRPQSASRARFDAYYASKDTAKLNADIAQRDAVMRYETAQKSHRMITGASNMGMGLGLGVYGLYSSWETFSQDIASQDLGRQAAAVMRTGADGADVVLSGAGGLALLKKGTSTAIGRLAGRAAIPLALASGVFETATAWQAADRERAAGAVGATGGGILGGISAGFAAGAAAGALGGAPTGPGVLITGVVGGVVGAVGGAIVGEAVAREHAASMMGWALGIDDDIAMMVRQSSAQMRQTLKLEHRAPFIQLQAPVTDGDIEKIYDYLEASGVRAVAEIDRDNNGLDVLDLFHFMQENTKLQSAIAGLDVSWTPYLDENASGKIELSEIRRMLKDHKIDIGSINSDQNQTLDSSELSATLNNILSTPKPTSAKRG